MSIFKQKKGLGRGISSLIGDTKNTTVKNKISIEVAWNDYIVSKFNNVVLVDEAKIRKKIDQLSEKNSVENILLSEIIFTIKENENLEKKFSIIENSINNIGFDETAKIYSVSESKKNGGKIGWVYKSQLSSKIANHLSKNKYWRIYKTHYNTGWIYST